MKNRLILLALPLLTACAPHPGAGKWKAVETNEAGISALTIAYDGRALFTSKRPAAVWHCFWSARSARDLAMSCTPSSHPDRERQYRFQVDEKGIGVLMRNDSPVARFQRLEGRPEIEE